MKFEKGTFLMSDKMIFNSEDLRRAMRRWTSGVTIVAACDADQMHGMTVNSFNSIALDPPLIGVALAVDARTCRMVESSGAFAITILNSQQRELSERFAGRTTESQDRFAGLETYTLLTGAPLLADGLAGLDCQVVFKYDAGASRLFIGQVVASRLGEKLPPLVYHEREYWEINK